MVANRPVSGKKYYTAAEANAALPLVKAVVRDITELARDLHERQERLTRVEAAQGTRSSELYQEEVDHCKAEIDKAHEQMHEYAAELHKLGIEMKDPFVGLVDFPCWAGNREVYLCWKLGETEVGHWHELDAGFAGRQALNKLGSKSVSKT